MIIETIIYVALIIALFAVCDNRFSRRYYVPLKVACSVSFLVILFIHQLYGPRLHLIFWPLIACFFGDLLMGLYNIYSGKRFISLGIVAFMLGHLGFLNYMCQIKPHTNVLVYILPFVPCILFFGMKKLCHLHMGSLLVPCLIYCYFVSLMTLKAIECGLNGKPIISSAGLLFLFSDFTILFLYFYHFRDITKKRQVHYVNLAAYYAAILLFIYSM